MVVAWGALAVAAMSVACEKPRPGGKCEVGQAICVDSSNVLACEGAVFVEARCRGPAGCTKVGTKVSCDDGVAEVGDACLQTTGENRACGGDKKQSLVCDHGKFTLVQLCRGPGGCQLKGDQVSCDTKLAEKGDTCGAPGVFACTPDLKSRVVCKDGKFGFDRNCRGSTGCHPSDQACDESISDIGDPCGTPGMAACNPDGSDLLTCQGGQFVKDHACKKTGCHVRAEGKVECL